jgi:hypothetical protein
MVILNNLACRPDPYCRCAVQPEIPLQITSWGEKNLLYTGKRLIQRNFKPASSQDPAALKAKG